VLCFYSFFIIPDKFRYSKVIIGKGEVAFLASGGIVGIVIGCLSYWTARRTLSRKYSSELGHYSAVTLIAVSCIFLMTLFHYNNSDYKIIIAGVLLIYHANIASIVDIQVGRIPNEYVISSLFSGGIAVMFMPGERISSVFGFLVASILFVIIYLLGNGKMGAGDVKLIAGLSLFLGFHGAMLAVLLTAIGGAIAACALLVIKPERKYFSYGPIISVSSLLSFLVIH
jgi:Flp pilus assembly protein protease CpaA